MKKKAIIGLLGWLFLLSCSDDETLMVSLGDNFINNQTSVSLVDTISVSMSTIKIDSLATSESTYLLAGSYTNDYLGKVSSTAYAQISMPTSVSIDDDEIFDSIVIRLDYSGYAYGDTLLPQTLKVYEVLEEIEPGDNYDDEPYLFNVTDFAYDDTPLGSVTVTPRPNQRDTLQIKLSDELGLEFLELLRDDDDEIDSDDDFWDYFEGIAIVPGDENNSILSFIADSSLQIQLYTHVVDEFKIENQYKFTYSSSNNHYNKISSDVTGTGLESLTEQSLSLSSEELNDMAFLQAGTGYVTRLDFPGISKVLEVELKNILYKAELVLKPVPGSYKQDELPQNLTLYYTDKNNNLVSEVTDDDGYSLSCTFYEDEFYGENTYYAFDITEYIYDELSDGYVDEEDGLIVLLSDLQSTVDNVVFDARTGDKYRPMLNLYYVFYE